MINEIILKKVIEKVVKNGLEFKSKRILWQNASIPHKERWIYNLIRYKEYYSIIFSPSFAKAYWGEKIMTKDGAQYKDYLKCCLDAGMTKEEAKEGWEFDEENFTIPTWQYYQHKMLDEVQAGREPLKYLEKFL